MHCGIDWAQNWNARAELCTSIVRVGRVRATPHERASFYVPERSGGRSLLRVHVLGPIFFQTAVPRLATMTFLLQDGGDVSSLYLYIL